MTFNVVPAALACLTSGNVARAATVAVCEPLKAGDPHLSARIEQDYREAATLAFEHYRAEHPLTRHRLKWCMEAAEPRKILERAVAPDTMAIVGFAFSGAAKIAAQFAEEKRVIYLSPAAALDDLFTDGFVKSLGVPMSRASKIAAEWIRENHPKRSVHILYAGDVAYARLQAQHLKRSLATSAVEHTYMQVDEGSLALNWVDPANPPIVILAGYAHQHFQTLKRLAKIAPATVFIATNQWAYAQDFLRSVVEGVSNIQLYAVSDFSTPEADIPAANVSSAQGAMFSELRKRAARFASDHQARFRRTPEAFSYSIYDAVYMALSNLQDTDTRDAYLKRIGASRWFIGASGAVKIDNGRFKKPGYLLKWNKDRFVPIKMSI